MGKEKKTLDELNSVLTESEVFNKENNLSERCWKLLMQSGVA